MMLRRRAVILLAAALFVFLSRANASPLFEDDTVLEINLTGPLSSLIKEKKNRPELPFTLSAKGIEHSIGVRIRGKSRIRVCDFPPLRIDFAQDGTEGTLFTGQDKLKLVTHCKHRSSADAYLLKEYSAYKIFSVISKIAYRVRLVRVTYTDTDGKLKDGPIERYGFLIESANELADRTGGQPVNVVGVSRGSLNDQQAASVYIFEYLIGNTDWSLVTADEDDVCCHNGDLFDIGSQRYYVPYDFDLSGLVNAPYAKPDPSLRISGVTKRLYRGYCMSTESLTEALRTIRSQKDEILGVLPEVPGLSQKDTDRAVKYLDKVFVQADDEDKLMRTFERRCL